jgi:hypothetical protein
LRSRRRIHEGVPRAWEFDPKQSRDSERGRRYVPHGLLNLWQVGALRKDPVERCYELHIGYQGQSRFVRTAGAAKGGMDLSRAGVQWRMRHSMGSSRRMGTEKL